MAAVVADRPIGSAFPIACPPTGLGIGRLDELRPGKDVDLEAKLPTDWGDQVRLFNIIANTTNSIRSALNGLAQRSS